MDIQHQLVVLNGNIDGSPARLVNARPLHAFLGVRRDFSNWVKSRIEKYEFEAGRDFVVSCSPNLANQTGPGGHRRSIDYFLTLDMAKELAMVERTPQGRLARRYFIERVTDLTGSLINTLRLRAGVRKYTEDLSHPSLVNLRRRQTMNTTMLALPRQAKDLWED